MADAETVDLRAVTENQQKVWSEGDFGRIGSLIALVAEQLCESADLRPGERVLDVACGHGNVALAAARRTWEPVVGLDYVPALLERGRERAAAERFEIEFVQGDAQEMPFEGESFDAVLSTFGVMFAPDQQRAADELLRVCRPGGRIGLANWIPEGFVGEMFKTVSGHAPPPPGVAPPPLWGTEQHLHNLFGDRISELRAERRTVKQRFRSPEHWLEIFRTWFGPTKVAFERVGPEGEEALGADLRALVERYNIDQTTLVLPTEYLEVVATKA
jgi:ubiquinone/menaquinone biosynthesis C-methylase UbiE